MVKRAVLPYVFVFGRSHKKNGTAVTWIVFARNVSFA